MPTARASTLVALLLMTACNAGNGNPTGGAGGTGGASNTTTNAGGMGAGTGGTGGDAAATKGGGIYVSSSSVDNGSGTTTYYSVSASFYDQSGVDGGNGASSCQRTDEGGCFLYLCTGAGGTTIPGAPPTAGSIEVSSSKTSTTLAPGADGTYQSQIGQTLFWGAGDTVHAEASGAQVPAFSVSTPAPSAVSITSPSMGPSVTLTIDTTQDLAFTWTGTSVGKVTVSVTSADQVTKASGIASCELDPTAGQGSIPASLLSKLPKATASASVSVVSRTTVDAGGFAIDLVATTSATSNGKNALALVILQ